tara:strand:+ start:253 stop:993 length:741 start_codon:yes stop_codon:yes gene_type:complete
LDELEITEKKVWEEINNKTSSHISERWLGDAYSTNLSKDLRTLISGRLGQQGELGWPIIKKLIHNYGHQEELLMAAGLCYQKEARDYLISLFRSQEKPNIAIVKALNCWGASLTIKDLKKIVQDKSTEMRLAGINLISFKSHLLNELEILELVEDLIYDFREEIVINVIRLLQRRDEELIVNCLTKATNNKNYRIFKTAIIALGAIGTKYSSLQLSNIEQGLTSNVHKEFIRKQLSHQYRKSCDLN